MIYLVIAIFCSVSVSLLLKILRQQQLDIRQTILTGYPVAFFLTIFLLKPDFSLFNHILQNPIASLLIILALGVLLPSVFIILGKAINSTGVVLTDACQRLSLILPIIASVLIFGEVIINQKMIGIILAFLALVAILFRPQSAPTLAKKPPFIWLIGVWLGYGVIDILFKQVAKQGGSFPVTLSVSFGLAFLCLFVYLWLKKVAWQAKALQFGGLLGVLNFANIYTYIKAHQALSSTPSLVFTVMNVGVIAFASIMGLLLFKEKLNKINFIGIGLAILSVFVLFY